MSKETSDAIVIKTVDFSESSLILTLYTRNFGKIHGIAKGARRLKNPFESALDLLSQISVSFIRKNSDVLDLLTEAKLRSRFRPTMKNWRGLNAGYYLAELLDLTTADGDPDLELFDLASATLDAYQTGERTDDCRDRFEWGLLGILGQRPSVRECVSCGEPIRLEERAEANGRVSFGFLDGGAICSACRSKQGFQQVAALSAEALLRLESLDAGLPETPPAPTVRGEMRGMLDYYFCTLLGRKPRTQDSAK